MRINWRQLFAANPGVFAMDLARKYGVADSTIRYAARRHGIILPNARKAPRVGRKKAVRADLHRAAIDGLTANQFCIARGICLETLKRAEQEYGIRLVRNRERSS